MTADEHHFRIPEVNRVFDRRRILFVILMFLVMVMVGMSSVNVALPSIEHGLGATDSDIQWILSAYALAIGLGLVPAGRAGDVLGRDAFFVTGVVVFMTGALFSGLAPTPAVLNVARIVQGLGSSLVAPQLTGMIVRYFEGRSRAMAFASMGVVASVAMAVGPTLSGAIITAVGEQGWRVAFLINLPAGLLALILAAMWFPFEKERGLWRHRRNGLPKVDLDPVGAVLLGAAVLSVMLPLIVKGVPAIWGLWVLSPVLGWLWVRWELAYRRRGRQPMVMMELFRVRSYSNQVMVSAAMFMANTPMFVVAALYTQQAHGATALVAGLIGLPNAVSQALAAWWAGRRAMMIGQHLVVIGVLLNLVGAPLVIGCAVLVDSTGLHYGWLALPLVLPGLGMGLFSGTNLALAMRDVPLEMAGTAGGVKQLAERMTTSIGTALVTAVLFAVLVAGGWTWAFAAGFATIAAIFVLGLWLAIRALRAASG
ncbi:MAG: MFS transporter [Propionibacterium sp.]|nr:MFS transporter [Propionibacterium sp.]